MLFVCFIEEGDKVGLFVVFMKCLEDVIVYEDEWLLVLNKLLGVVSYGGSGISFGVIEILCVLCLGRMLELVYWLDWDMLGLLIVVKKWLVLSEL